ARISRPAASSRCSRNSTRVTGKTFTPFSSAMADPCRHACAPSLTSSPNMFGSKVERRRQVRIAPEARSVHIQLQMIATSGRSSEDPLPRLGTEGAEAPEFQVLFSRPENFTGRPDLQPNSFRWSGSGTIHIMERGLLIIARRRSAMAFHTTEERFVPAAEICDVYREGNSVRVELRGELQQRDYFRFWTADTATARTIV